MTNLLRYRTVVYAATLATGFSGLIYQVVWQKYLAFAVGSDSRAVALVVATFLGGLAAGYRFWGERTERESERRRVLRLYGFLELGIGAYAAVFLPWFAVVRRLSYHAPAWLATDALVAVLTLVPATFLMGATIPLLVRALPDRPDEVHLCHARIYGINTLGACLGAFGSSLVLIPRLGLSWTLGLASVINLLVGVLFVFNPLSGRISAHEPIAEIPNRFGLGTIYFYTLVTGTVTLSLEVVVVRLLHLAIGAGPHNFALVVGVFVLGLALGSLSVTGRMLSVRVLLAALVLAIGDLILVYFSIPYWPYWLSNLRALLPLEPASYGVAQVQVVLFMCLVLLPFLVALGFMLPLAYALLPKDTSDYGKTCGRLYFYNTVGTALGAVVLSYVLLRWLDLDQVFKLDVLLLSGLAVLLCWRDARRVAGFAVLIVGLAFAAGPRWNRGSHHTGLFQYLGVQPFNFKGLFSIPDMFPDVLFFKDGPDSTITVTRYTAAAAASPSALADPPAPGPPPVLKGLVNNGRGEADMVLDYSTMTLAAMLPYFYAADRPDLDAAIVGLGSGVTAGLLGQAADVRRVRVIEISPTLIQAVRHFREVNRDVLDNPKVEIVAMDGFKYFARAHEPLDIIISTPSVPWVAGVENLFTPEYYRMARRALKDDGVFMQWFPLYSVNADLFRTILRNLLGVFPNLRLFQISDVEVGVLASTHPFAPAALPRRLAEPTAADACGRIHFTLPEQLLLIERFDTREIAFLAANGPSRTHTLTHPGLSYVSDRIRSLQSGAVVEDFLDPRLTRLARFGPERAATFQRLLAALPTGVVCARRYGGAGLFCEEFNVLRDHWAAYTGGPAVPCAQRVAAYDALRQAGVIPMDAAFLHAAVRTLLDSPDDLALTAQAIFVAYAKDGLFDDARQDLERLAGAGRLSPEIRNGWLDGMEQGRRARDEFVSAYERTAR